MNRTFVAITFALALVSLTGCADVLLHDTKASYLKVIVQNMPMENGQYSLSGDFGQDPWNNNTRIFTVTAGKGTYDGSADTPIFSNTVQFTVVPKASWARPWLGATSGNEATGLPPYGGFKMTVPTDGSVHTLTVDGSTKPVTLSLDGTVQK